jgi:hypothetical protein
MTATTTDAQRILAASPYAGDSEEHEKMLATLDELISQAAPELPLPTALPRGELALPKQNPLLAGTGYPRAGKDTIADYLWINYAGIERIAYSDVWILEANAWLATVPELSHHSIHIGNKNDYMPYRRLLQHIGIIRRQQNPQYLAERMAIEARKLMAREGVSKTMLNGARDEADLAVAKAVGGETARVVRPDNDYVAESPIEKALDHVPDSAFDHVFYNDGSLADYLRKIENRFGIGEQYANGLTRRADHLLGAVHPALTWGAERRVRESAAILGHPTAVQRLVAKIAGR